LSDFAELLEDKYLLGFRLTSWKKVKSPPVTRIQAAQQNPTKSCPELTPTGAEHLLQVV
jgi:hypothetical protein